MANTRISDLTASASNLASTDLAPVVQTAGVGPVKMTGAQIAAGLLSATTPIGSGPILSRAAAATLQLGAADAAAPVAQTFKVQGVVAGTTNTAGANFTIQGSQGTGTGAGGSIIFQVAPAGSSGTAQNAYQTVLQITGAGGLTGQDGATANTLALKNSTNPQIFRAYSTTTGPSYGYFASGVTDAGVATADTLFIGTGGAGAAMTKLALVVNGTTQLDYNSSYASFVRVNQAFVGATGTSTALFGSTDTFVSASQEVNNQFRLISASSGSLPTGSPTLNLVRSRGTLASPTITGADDQLGVINFVAYDGSSRIACANIIGSVDGAMGSGSGPGRMVFSTTASGASSVTERMRITSTGLITFGGTTSSFPALKRSSATLQVRLADDSALTDIEALNLTNGRTIQKFTPLDNQPPATNFATLDTRNSIAVLDFDDTTAESAVFVGVISAGAILTSGISVRIHWMATSATSGDCRWSVAFEDMNTDLDTDSFDTATAGNSAANGTNGVPSTLTLTCTTIDSLVAGDFFRIKVTRDAANAGDTMTGDAELIAVEIRQVA